MGLQALKPPPFKPEKPSIVTWDHWRKGLNTLLRENEIDGAELVQATNLLLIGSGVPTKRWGSDNYYLSGATTGGGRGLLPVKNVDGTIEVLSMTDWGILVKKANASYAVIAGASWASGYNLEGTQLGGNVYLANGNRELVRYNFSTLTGFPTLAIPTALLATNISLGTGLTTWSWRVTAVSKVGETIASTAVSLASLPQTLDGNTVVRLSWTATSAASGDLRGYNVYRGAPGDEVFVGGVDDITTRFDDLGASPPDPFRVTPDVDTTGGPKGKYIIRYQDRLVMAGIDGDPSKVIISGRYPLQERFDWQAGGGFILIEPDAGDDITGIATYFNTGGGSGGFQTIIVFKENSVWEVVLNTVTFGNFTILDPQYRLLTKSQGCSSHRSIVAVENDLMFSNRRGIYILRYEPQLLNVINTSELSAKIRPFFEALTDADLTSASAAYVDKKYVLSFPTSKKSIVFDRERLAFVGPWTTTFGINQWGRYVDADGMERWIAIDADDNYVTEFRETYTDDKGTAFRTVFKTKKEDFGDWTIFKTLNEIYMLFRNVVGSVAVNIYLEERSGATVTAKSFSVTSSIGASGFGTDLFGLSMFGLSNNDASITSNELPKKSYIYKTARTFQIELQTTGKTDDYELLGIKAVAIPQSRGNSPSSWVA